MTMDRRQFLTRSAALVAISALPIPQAKAAIEPKMASGLIEGLTFHVKEPIRLIADGPLRFINCRFVLDNSEVQGAESWPGIKFTPNVDDGEGMFLIANPHGYDVGVDRCHIDMTGMRTKGAAMFFDSEEPIRLKWGG